MGRRPRSLKPSTRLGAALVARRGARQQRDVAAEIGANDTTISRLERGTMRPSLDTAAALARWLGWTLDEVYAAAREPAPDEPGDESTGPSR